MDDLRTQENLVLKFCEMSNELLLECSYLDSFLYQWLELLHDSFDFSPVFFSVSSAGKRTVFSNDSRLEQKMKPYENQKILPGSLLDGLVVSLVGEGIKDPVFAFPEELRDHPLSEGFQRFCPFYLKEIIRKDELSRKLRLARFETDLSRAFEDEPCLESLLNLLESSLQNDVVFLYEVPRQVLHFPEDLEESLQDRTKDLIELFERVIYERNLFSVEDHEQRFRNLILYPLFSEDDILAVLGTYSSRGGTTLRSDMSLICEFCSHPKLGSWVDQKFGDVNKLSLEES